MILSKLLIVSLLHIFAVNQSLSTNNEMNSNQSNFTSMRTLLFDKFPFHFSFPEDWLHSFDHLFQVCQDYCKAAEIAVFPIKYCEYLICIDKIDTFIGIIFIIIVIIIIYVSYITIIYTEENHNSGIDFTNMSKVKGN